MWILPILSHEILVTNITIIIASCKMGTGSFPGGKVRPGRAADHSPRSSAAIMEE